MIWSYGVTTVPSRRHTLLPQTLASLAASGFDAPRLFIDGECDLDDYSSLGLSLSHRVPRLNTAANWVFSMVELYVRSPNATRFAIFQDDMRCVSNLRSYLEHVRYPENGYLNLYTTVRNAELLKGREDHRGFYPSNQLGQGAVGLVFSRDAVTTLLSNQYTVLRIQDQKRGWRLVDGGIATAMKNAGWQEYVHNPSLVEHFGMQTSMDKKRKDISKQWYAKSASYPGDHFDAMSLLA